MKAFKSLIENNFSLLVMVMGSGSYFISNILLKNSLKIEDYGLYSLIITYVSLTGSFGLLGFEQSLLRFSKIDNHLILDRFSFQFSLLASCIFSLALSAFIYAYYNFNMHYLILFFLFVSTSICMLIFNMQRLNRQFVYAQVINNCWRIVILVAIIYFLFFELNIKVEFLVLIIIFVQIAIILLFFCISYKRYGFKIAALENNATVLSMSFSFFISLFSLSFLNYFDRIIIEKRFGMEELGNYFFLVNFFLFPFSLLQTYVGFKEIVSFKIQYNFSILKRKIIKVALFGFGMSFLLLFLGYIFDQIDSIANVSIVENFQLIICLLLIGITKLVYSLLSSALGAIGKKKTIKSANIWFNSMLFAILCAAFYLEFSHVIHFVILFMIFWLIRGSVWLFQLYKLEIDEIIEI